MHHIRWKSRLLFYGSLLAVVATPLGLCTFMPGASANTTQKADVELAESLRSDVTSLVEQFPSRNLGSPSTLTAATNHLEHRLGQASGVPVERERVKTTEGSAFNLIAEVPGNDAALPRIVVGAHYDTAPGTPGANDNGTGVAALLALADRLREHPAGATVRFVLFANEEPPYFQSNEMGSLVHARAARQRGENIRAMLSLETMGFYSDEPLSQRYPFPLAWVYPSKGNFIAFVGNVSNLGLVRESVAAFRRHVRFPSEGGALPGILPGVGWSDHWSFWEHDYPAIMVTDTAPFRDPHYHRASDDLSRLDFARLAVVVEGVEGVIRELAAR